MPVQTSAQARIQDLQAQIELLKDTAIKELREKRVAIAQELHIVDAEIRRLNGKTLDEPRSRSHPERSAPKSVTFEELKHLLGSAPNKKLNLRKAGLDVKAVKALAEASAGVLKIGGKGAWPDVTLIK